jgi:AcrR family transcriptional regulator
LVVSRERYHHGALRRAVLDGALAVIDEQGLAALSLREVARRAGVSHAAPAHHFGDKAGVLTAIAIEGFELLAATTRAATEPSGSLVEGGTAYIRFATEHRAHYEVMFRPDLYHSDDRHLSSALAAAANVLFDAVRKALGPGASEADTVGGVIAAWSFAHGFASLWSAGNIPGSSGSDPEDLARQAAAALVQLARSGASA